MRFTSLIFIRIRFASTASHHAKPQNSLTLKLVVATFFGLRLLRLVSPLLPLTLGRFPGSFPRHEWDGGHARDSSQV